MLSIEQGSSVFTSELLAMIYMLWKENINEQGGKSFLYCVGKWLRSMTNKFKLTTTYWIDGGIRDPDTLSVWQQNYRNETYCN